ncbi:copper resistance CopC family protein [Candidatus Nitrospira inopinata]|jgi:methionine-rich copper-binding protein CopC|uniref:Putative Copper resistance protein CopC n=1 Tax=Candidatus Nitrospira inopinata TaxID=1715989 RepID=A0A0S4KSU3_9BACT|nr:copper resistance CopC family protein [Candidatus Nitrospira inopinata]CUQ66831.1 putative Copper resistance protein CopC [Candidatus Nitrospira inopinata]
MMVQAWRVHALSMIVLAIVTMTMMMGIAVPPAHAHSKLVKSEPPQRAVLSKPPEHVRLWFNEEIEGDYATLVVLDAAKHPVTDLKPHVAQDDAKSIVLPLPELQPGKYSVKFRVLSVDGHVVESSFDFVVKDKDKVHGK